MRVCLRRDATASLGPLNYCGSGVTGRALEDASLAKAEWIGRIWRSVRKRPCAFSFMSRCLFQNFSRELFSRLG